MVLLVAILAAAGAALLVVLRRGSTRAATAQRRLDEGRFQEALAAAGDGTGDDRDAALSAAVAAKHLLDLDLAAKILRRLVANDPDDGEAWLETGLVAAYQGRLDDAETAFDRVASSRSDLLESLTLHRAWTAELAGDRKRAERLFGEIELPLETKLRQDLGEGDPAFAEWFLHAGLLWRERGDEQRADWALGAALDAAPQSRLVAELATSDASQGPGAEPAPGPALDRIDP